MYPPEGIDPARSADIKNFKSAAILIAPIMAALVIISALTLAGQMSGVGAGSSIIGLSAAFLLIQVVLACRNKTPSMKAAPLAMTIIPVVSIILGALALSGNLPLSTAAWTVCGSSAGVSALAILALLGSGCVAASIIHFKKHPGNDLFGSAYQPVFNDNRDGEWVPDPIPNFQDSGGDVMAPMVDAEVALADWKKADQTEDHT